MTADDYLRGILARTRATVGPTGPALIVRQSLLPDIRVWAGEHLREVVVSGSYAKRTAIRGGTDLDLFISLRSDTPYDLKQIYTSLHRSMAKHNARPQNVSIGIVYQGYKVDLVPGRQQSPHTTDHSLYVSRRATWTKTNVTTHIQQVLSSGHTAEICLLKRWRQINGLEFPSFAMELATLRALQYRPSGALADNVWVALTFFRDHMQSVALPDPGNLSNNVADELTASEKSTIASKASTSLQQQTWSAVLW